MVSLAQRQTLGFGRGGRRENGDWRGDRRRQRESAFERLRSIVGLSCPNSPASTSPVAESISTSATGEIDGAEAISSEEVVFALLADDYGLTRREAEVLPYLARGRSAKVIAEALFVSESTIRTHTRRILEKTCLHSKQELIDLVEKY